MGAHPAHGRDEVEDHVHEHDLENDHEHGHMQAHDHGHEHGLLGALRELVGGHGHPPGKPLDAALEASSRGIRAVKVSLVGLGLTAVGQLGVALVTGSVALLSDTLHNFADASSALPLWLAFTFGRRRPTRRFTYGYGRSEDIAGLVVVGMIAASAVLAAWQAIARLMDPVAPSHLWAVGAAGVVGYLGNEVVARYRLRVGREIGSAALVADGLHARTDALTSLGVIAGAAGVALGLPAADPIAGLAIAVLIMRVLWEAARDVFMRLMDGVDPALVDRAASTVAAVDGVVRVGQLRLRWIGHRLHAELEVAVDAGLSVAEGHAVAEQARHALLHHIPHLTSAIVHADPAGVRGGEHHGQLAHHPDPFAGAELD